MKSMKRRTLAMQGGRFCLILLSLGFISMMSGDSGSGRSIQNIKTFARLYGYVRYFYPGDEAASLDWEKFAVYGAKKVESAPSDEALKKSLEELFLPIAPGLTIHFSGQTARFSAADITPPQPEGMKTIGWQHYGHGFGPSPQIYRSARLNRKTPIAAEESFGGIMRSVDANPFRGMEVKLRAAVKAAAGQGQLWLRVDRENGQRGFFENMDDRPVRTDRWDYYEISGPVADDALYVNWGCFLMGLGEIYVDDFKVFVKKAGPAGEWEPFPLTNPGFEADKDGDPPGQWFARPSQVYSFKVGSAAAAEGKKSVCIKGQPAYLSGPLPNFEPAPKIGDFIAKDIGSGLSCLMPIALYGSDTQTYPQASPEKLDGLLRVMQSECPGRTDGLSGDDLHVRLADVVMAWNVFRHFFPYFDAVKTDWPAALGEALAGAYADKNRWDFLKTLRRLTATLNDGHVGVRLPGNAAENYLLPLDWEWIEDRLVITRIFDSALTDVRAGDVVETINGGSAKDALEREEQFISAATPGWKRYRSLTAIRLGEKDKIFKLEISRDKLRFVSNLKASLSIQDFYALRSKDALKYKILEDGVYYLNLSAISGEEIVKLLPELQKAKGLICDLRGYPNGNHNLIRHLLKMKDTARWMGIPRIIRPDYEDVSFDTMGWNMEPAQPALSAKVVFLTDGRAISYAESYLGYIEGYKLATVVGQTTAGTNGNVNSFTLPGGYTISWTGMRVVKIDGSRHHGVGIKPQVPMERTIAGVRAGRDEFLEKALDIVKR